MRLFELFQETILMEGMVTFDRTVDAIYKEFFSEHFKEINQMNVDHVRRYAAGEFVRSVSIDQLIRQGIVKDRNIIETNEISPAIMIFNDVHKGNLFVPRENSKSRKDEIYVTIASSVLDSIRLHPRLSKKELIDEIEERNGQSVGITFQQEFRPVRAKASINHELSHWYDNTVRNRHISNRLIGARNIYNDEIAAGRSDEIASKRSGRFLFAGNQTPSPSNYEIEAFMSNVRQTKRANRSKWDSITFDEMLNLIPPALGIKHSTTKTKEWGKWRRLVLARMAREGLLGRNMR